MTPDRPLRWIGTTKRNRDQGLFHLEATVQVRSYKNPLTHAVVVAACGAQPFAYSGGFPYDDPFVSPGVQCQRCVALLEPKFCQCPNPDCLLRATISSVQRARVAVPCPCGKFTMRDYVPVPR